MTCRRNKKELQLGSDLGFLEKKDNSCLTFLSRITYRLNMAYRVPDQLTNSSLQFRIRFNGKLIKRNSAHDTDRYHIDLSS